jgi:hypothetical protein
MRLPFDVRAFVTAGGLMSSCRHLTALDVEVARGTRSKPRVWDPVLELLAKRGALHEASYLDLTNLKRRHAAVSARPSASA